MSRVVVTAFEPYGPWRENASWLVLVELTRNLPPEPDLVTWRLPVDFDAIRRRVGKLVEEDAERLLLLGQSPGVATLVLERIALNRGGEDAASGQGLEPLEPDGPLAYETDAPVDRIVGQLNHTGVPAVSSCHAGTFLCNALYYHVLHAIRSRGLDTQALFVHLPLAPQQVAELLSTGGAGSRKQTSPPSWSSGFTADAVLALLAAWN